MKKVIFDCDNTFGVPGCDVDDGLALLYLLGSEEIDLLGVTTTYGNNKIDVVYPNTVRMLKDVKREDIPCKKGGPSKEDDQSEASDFLAEMADRYPGELSILATGSLTNLKGAYKKDPEFLKKVKEIVLMGGITAPLVFSKMTMDELNFSCDPEASKLVLTQGNQVSIITGNNCLKVLFTRKDHETYLSYSTKGIAPYIAGQTGYWFDINEKYLGIPGFYNWDATAAAYLTHPELFEDKKYKMKITEEDLNKGFLQEVEEGENCILNLPEIKSGETFIPNIYNTWLKVMI